MVDEALLRELDRYIKRHYIEDEFLTEGQLSRSVDFDKLQLELQERLNENRQSLAEYIQEWIKKKGMSESDVRNGSMLSRNIFSKIRINREYHPEKRTVFALALALHLSYDEAREFMSFMGYAFGNLKEDIAIRFFFEKEIYNIMKINEYLVEFGFDVLGSGLNQKEL
jgi:transcriptional regulator with XRE-family HTH domain